MSEQVTSRSSGVGLDVGTAFLVKAEQVNNEVVYTKERDAFFSLDASDETLGVLDMIGASYIKDDKLLYVVGEEALRIATMMTGNLQRPLRNGVISNQEREAIPILREIIKGLVGPAQYDGECISYTVPAAPVNADFDIVYHENIINMILTDLGYDPQSVNEAQCVVFSELANEKFTGIAISCGAGMSNVSLSMMGIPAVTFAIVGGGDWVDQNAAKAITGYTVPKVTARKEKGINILSPSQTDDVEIALSIYYKSLIDNIVKGFHNAVVNAEKIPTFMDPISIVVAGGTSLAGGFTDYLKTVIAKYDFPFEIKEVRHAQNALYTVSDGALRAALIRERKKRG